MKSLALTLMLVFATLASADSLLYFHQWSGLTIGEEQITVKIVLSTPHFDMETCEGTGKPTGFMVGERQDTKKLIVYCGSNLSVGEEFTILVEKGI